MRQAFVRCPDVSLECPSRHADETSSSTLASCKQRVRAPEAPLVNTRTRSRPRAIASHDATTLVIVLTLSLLLTIFALFAFYRVGMDRSDFFLFYRSGRAWLTGASLYPLDENPNLNPPLAVVTLFAPLARLPYRLAQTIWTLAGALALAGSLRVIRRELELSAERIVWVVAILSITHAAFLVWLQGQLTWILLYPVTRAWTAWRSGRPAHAGLWLGPVVAVKPILALLPLALSWPVWATAGLVSACLTGLGIAWTGWDPWTTWLRVGAGVRWLSWPPNASLWGIAARIQSGRLKGLSIRELNPVAVAVVLAVALICWIAARRERTADRRFVLAVFWSLLISPLGWIYYLPLGLGAMIASWPPTPWVWAAVASMVVPFHMIQPWFKAPAVVRTFGCLYGAGVMWAFVVWSLSGRAHVADGSDDA